MSRVRVTVAMAAYNAAATVAEAVASVLAQTLRDWELLVADDGSSDATLKELARFADPRIRVHTDRENLGKPARLNQLMARARGPLLAIMDADDIAYPDRLERQVALLDARPELDLVAAGMTAFDADGTVLAWRRMRTEHATIVRRPWAGFHFNSPTWTGRTAWFRRHGYRDGLRTAEDEDLLLRSHGSSRFAAVPDFLVAYRIDRWSWRKARRMRSDHARALADAFRSSGDPRYLAGVGLQGLKLAREAAAVAAGRDAQLLAARMRPVSDDDAQAFRDVVAAARAIAERGAP